MKSFEYARPESIGEAVSLLGEDTRLLAGGTDLLTLMKDGISSPTQLLDIKRLPDLSREVAIDGDEITIGALTSLADLGRDPIVREHLPALFDATGVAQALTAHVDRLLHDWPDRADATG